MNWMMRSPIDIERRDGRWGVDWLFAFGLDSVARFRGLKLGGLRPIAL